MSSILDEQLNGLITQFGTDEIGKALRRLERLRPSQNSATIIVNEGVHKIPDALLRGEVYTVYRGSLDLTNETGLIDQLSDSLSDLADFLLSKKWSHIAVVISGHAIVNMQVKLLIYRITHLYTLDWVFDGKGSYLAMEIDLRSLILNRRRRV